MGEPHDEQLAQRRYVASEKRAALLKAKVERASIDAAEAAATAQTAPAAEIQFWRALWEKLKKHMEVPPKE